MPAKKILMIVGDFVEDYEAMVPFQMLLMVGHNVHAICPGKKKGDTVKTAVHDFDGSQTYSEKLGHNFTLNCDFEEARNNVQTYDGLVIPGGRAPEYLRTHQEVLDVVGHFVKENKPIAALCHGPQILCAIPGALKGKKATAYTALKADIVNAGAEWVGDCGVTGAVVDGNLVTGVAWPGHPEWIAKFLQLLGTKIEP